MKKRVFVSVFSAMFIIVIMANVSSAVTFGPAVNLGPGVNTGDDERFPDISSDALDLYLSSDRTGGSGSMDLHLSTRPDTASSFGLPTNLGTPINSTDWDSGPSISPNGLALFFGSSRPGGLGIQDIWVSTRPTTSDVFGTPFTAGTKPASPVKVNTIYNDFAPDIHDSGLSMIFTSDRTGNNDLYVAKRAVIGAWDTVFNLASVNTIHNDIGGTISSDGLSLFFTSDRPGGFGGYDLYAATRPDLVSPFGPAVNMGAGINSIYDDMAPSISSDGSTLYFDSNMAGGHGGFDIYQSTAVPEPGTIALLGIGLAGLAGASARRKLKTKSRQ